MPRASLLLLEDDTFARTTLSNVLTHLGYSVNSFQQASQAINYSKTNRTELALLDIDLGPGPSGLDIAYVLRRINPKIGLVFLTSYSDPRFVGSGKNDLPAGSRYLIKSQLNDISVLETIIDQTLQNPLRTSRKLPKVEVRLTHNQIRILESIAAGKTTGEIAEQLGVTEKSIEATISRIHATLGDSSPNMNKRVKLTNYYYRLIGKL